MFEVSWVLSSLVRGLLSSWHGSFVGKKRRKVSSFSFLFFGQFGRKDNDRVSDQVSNSLFFVLFGLDLVCF